MKVLITCPRAPVTIEWLRVFKKAGIDVLLADSLRYPIAKYFNGAEYVKIASPKLNFPQYKRDMKRLVAEVDWVIPNCEEIFYLSKIREEIQGDAFFFMPESELLFTLHHKFDFFKLLNTHVKFPNTKLITGKDKIVLGESSILKPVFSRFGQNVIRDVNRESIKKIEPSSTFPWVQQEKIEGTAVCNYALLNNGNVVAHVAYRPRYLLNASASTYFEPYVDKRLDRFMETFAEESGYTGQVAFDFIDNGNDLYVIECNPRATSGLHLLSEGLSFADGELLHNNIAPTTHYRVGTTLYTLFGINAILNGEFKTLQADYKNAKDVLRDMPFYAQFLSMFEIVARSFIYKKPLTLASTFDIEFDG